MTATESHVRKERERAYHNQAFSEGTRAEVAKFYSVVQASRARYLDLLAGRCAGARVLEYGCGPGSYSFRLAEMGAQVVGIDISDVAIAQCRATAAERRLETAEFHVMDAESLAFPDASFDLICGTGILHHLDLSRALPELARTLRPGGTATFIEPMGHNPLLELYRRRTPQLRTVDEHPLRMPDFDTIRRHFGEVDAEFFHLLSLAAIPFRRLPGFVPLMRGLDAADRALFRLVPYFRRHSWVVVLRLSEPRRGATR